MVRVNVRVNEHLVTPPRVGQCSGQTSISGFLVNVAVSGTNYCVLSIADARLGVKRPVTVTKFALDSQFLCSFQ